jgi:hypothetical protein
VDAESLHRVNLQNLQAASVLFCGYNMNAILKLLGLKGK